jgi:adenylate kinase
MKIQAFVFMGLPGSGKGAQSALLSEHLKCPVFSTGNRLRELAQEDTAIGKKIKGILNSGGLMPAWLASFLFEEAILKLKEGEQIIFEGVGRKEEEAELFTDICEWLGHDFRVIFLDVKEETIIARIHKRRELENRGDDSDETLKNRLDNYMNHTLPALNYFRTVGKVVDVNGEPLQPEVFAEVVQKLGV